MPGAEFQDAGVSTRSVDVTRADVVDQLLSDFDIADLADDLTMAVESTLRCLGDQLLCDGSQRFGLASVVSMASAANSDAARFAIIDFWCEDEPPRLLPLVGVGIGATPTDLRSCP